MYNYVFSDTYAMFISSSISLLFNLSSIIDIGLTVTCMHVELEIKRVPSTINFFRDNGMDSPIRYLNILNGLTEDEKWVKMKRQRIYIKLYQTLKCASLFFTV